MSAGWLPRRRLRVQTATPKNKAERKHKGFHHNPAAYKSEAVAASLIPRYREANPNVAGGRITPHGRNRASATIVVVATESDEMGLPGVVKTSESLGHTAYPVLPASCGPRYAPSTLPSSNNIVKGAYLGHPPGCCLSAIRTSISPQAVQAIERGNFVAFRHGGIIEHRLHEIGDFALQQEHRLPDVQQLHRIFPKDVDPEQA